LSIANAAGFEQRSSLKALVEIIQSVLEADSVGAAPADLTDIQAFSRWYLDCIQQLEKSVAQSHNQKPFIDTEFELMCRCALTGGNLREAIELAVQFSRVVYPRGGKQSLQTEAQTAIFSLSTMRSENNPTSDLLDITGLYAYYRLFQWLVGVDFELQVVRLGPAQRDNILPQLCLFNAAALAGGQSYTLEFDPAYLELPTIRSATELPAMLSAFPAYLHSTAASDLPRQVRAMLLASIQRGSPLPGLTEVADTLRIPHSTFRRHLATAGASFTQLKEDCLRQQSQHLLSNTDLPVSAIAQRLGYRDDRSFRRAFHQWFDLSPAQWRDRQDQSSLP
jgi:AraC-like DNA-binding protein